VAGLRTQVFLDDPAIVSVIGRVDRTTLAALRRALEVAAGADRRDVELDLSATGSMSVEALALVRACADRLAWSGHRLRVVSASHELRDPLAEALGLASLTPNVSPGTGHTALAALHEPDSSVSARARHRVPELQRSGGREPAVPSPIRAPYPELVALEPRALYEFWAFVASYPVLQLLGRGDGHPVMVLPPFAADDAYTSPLRSLLRGLGYAAHGWHQGTNLSRTRRIVEGLPARLVDLQRRHGARVSLIGHSGGGLWARDLARALPEAVRQVITLGCPFRLRPGDATQADPLASLLLVDQVPQDPGELIDEEFRPPVPVPVTAIYTRTDGVASWWAGIQSEGPRRENVEVFGSHCGLVHNPAAIIAIIDRLAQPEGSWQPFDPPTFARHLFPKPAYWQPKTAAAA
jgi:pimeloyl-ACP methyl ester carboxylesterase/anti-anti-sigma regulatory factor